MKHLLLDTNVILDVLLNRSPWVNDSGSIWKLCDRGEITGYVCASAITDIYFIAKDIKGDANALQAVDLCLDTFAICNVDRNVLKQAVALVGQDFEDNLQIACAISFHLDAIITRDGKGFRSSPIPVYSPSAWLAYYVSLTTNNNNF
ncbi:MAG: PIN domain-containing protein [Caldilineaceae bacterium]